MDPAIVAAYRTVALAHRCSVDEMLADPAVRNDFLAACHTALGDGPSEKVLLKRLIGLRKCSKLPPSRQLFAESAAAV